MMREIKKYYALTHQQEQIISVEMVFPNTSVNTIVNTSVANTSLSLDDISRVLCETVKSVDTLRVRFSEQDGKIVQYFTDEYPQFITHKSFIGNQEEYDSYLAQRAECCLFGFDKPLCHFEIVTRPDGEFEVVASFHHSIADAWSCATVLTRVLSELSQGKEPNVYSFEQHLIDISAVNEQKSAHKREKDRIYWKTKFENYVGNEKYVIEPQTDIRCTRLHYELSSEQSYALHDYCKKLNCSLPMVFLGLISLIKAYRNGENFATISFAALGRHSKSERNCFGYFINVLPLLISIDRTQKIDDYIKMIKREEYGLFRHASYPMDDLRKDIRDSGNEARNLVDISFSFQNAKYNSEVVDYFNQPQWIPGKHQTIPLCIHISDRDDSGILMVDYDYVLSMYCKEDVEWYHNELILLIEQLTSCDCPENMTINQLSMVNDTERMQILEIFQGNQGELLEGSVVSLLEECCDRNPDSWALKSDTTCYTYRELKEATERIASNLIARGVGYGSRVAVLAKRCPETILCICGIIKAGAVYVPIDPAYPDQRVQLLLDNVCPSLFLLEQSNETLAKETRVCTFQEILSLDATLDTERLHDNQKEITPESEAYIIFTSGTTGVPKGVIVRHREIVALVRGADYVPLDSLVRILQTGSLAFDAATFEIWGALLNGGMVFLAEKDVMLSPNALKECLSQQRINTMFITTALFNEMVKTDVSVFDSLSYLLFGGEKTSEKCVDLLMSHHGSPRVHNVYGPTEATTFATFYPIPRQRIYSQTPIGHAINFMKTYVLQDTMLCGIGIPGELCIGGVGVAKGYLNDEELTAKKFIKNPYGDGVLYRTGDVVEWNEHGELIFMGRIDSQVKIRGFRIEPREIDAAINQHPFVQDAITVVRENPSGEKCLVAYVVLDDNLDEKALNDIRDDLRTNLPEYMIPIIWMQIERLPITSNGKVDTRALPAIAWKSAEDEYLEPSTAEEIALCDSIAEILGLERVGLNDTFFEIGGDSIKSIRVITAMKRRGYELSVRNLLQYQSPGNICRNGAVLPLTKRYPQEELTGSFALSPIQMMFQHMGLKNPNHFNQALMLEVNETVDEEILNKAMGLLLEHHDILRARFDGGNQIIMSAENAKPVAFHKVVFSRSYQDAMEQIEQCCTEWQSALSLTEGKNIGYGQIFCTDKVLLLIYAHHMVIDGVSWHILLEQLNNIYQSLLRGSEMILPPKTMFYGHWVNGLMDYAASDEIQEQRGYWSEICQKIADNAAYYVGDSGAGSGVGAVKTVLNSSGFERLYQHYRTLISIGEDELLMALFGVALQQWKGIGTLCVDVEKHGRDLKDEDLSASVGWFTTKYPFVCPIDADFYSMLQSVKQAGLNVPNNGVGYGLLKYYAGCTELGNISAPVCFNYLGDANMPSNNNQLFQYTPYSVGKMSADENELFNPLSFDSIKTEEGIICTLSYRKCCYCLGEMEQLSGCIQQALELALAAMDSKDEVKVTFAKEVVDEELLDKIDMEDLSILDDLFGLLGR